MKQNNPDIHHRHSIRLKGYDYSQEGLYFITICTQNHKHLFGEIKNVPHVGTVGAGSACPESNINIPQMILNPYGEIIQQCYWDLEHKYPNIECCEYVIMPNHFHAIIKIDRGTMGIRPITLIHCGDSIIPIAYYHEAIDISEMPSTMHDFPSFRKRGNRSKRKCRKRPTSNKASGG